MSSIHLAKVPFDAEEDVSAHNEPVGILLVVGRNGVREVPGLVQDVVDLDAKIESADILRDFRIPLPLWLAVTGRITLVENIG